MINLADGNRVNLVAVQSIRCAIPKYGEGTGSVCTQGIWATHQDESVGGTGSQVKVASFTILMHSHNIILAVFR